MSILSREADCYPPDLLDGAHLPADAPDRRWWLVYTRSRREKDLTRRLGAKGVPFYCPTISRRTRGPSGRVREAFVPLFSSYLFLFGSEEERYASLTTNCVSTVGPVTDQDRLVRELRSIRRLISSNVPIVPESRLQAGAPVRVVTGPLRGQEGFVIERRGRRRLLVAVELLQRGASADLDECDVEPI